MTKHPSVLREISTEDAKALRLRRLKARKAEYIALNRKFPSDFKHFIDWQPMENDKDFLKKKFSGKSIKELDNGFDKVLDDFLVFVGIY